MVREIDRIIKPSDLIEGQVPEPIEPVAKPKTEPKHQIFPSVFNLPYIIYEAVKRNKK